jgi:ankyrin repeat protein
MFDLLKVSSKFFFSASVHMQNVYGWMPLHEASHHGLFSIVTLLLKFGADVDTQDNNTITPLLLVS